MAGNQQFCLRWNNHQSTLVSVFDTLLESGTLVDCTLAAEGQYLKAHKVVLSACSPYLEALLSQHYEKHPIIILKDVSFIELKAMLDYMYRGEVNISQDQLGTFLKAAESLHIKGLTDNSGGGEGLGKRVESQRKAFNPPAAKSPAFPQGLVVEPRPYRGGGNSNNNNNNNNNSTTTDSGGAQRDGSLSPKRREKRRKSCEEVKSEPEFGDSAVPPSLVHCSLSENASPSNVESVVKPEPKSDEMNNEDSAEEKQFDEEDDDEMDVSKPGTSHGSNSHPTGVWNASADASAEEPYTPGGLQEQGATRKYITPMHLSWDLWASMQPNLLKGAINNPGFQGSDGVECSKCGRHYKLKSSLRNHQKWECGKEPQFQCPYCNYRAKQKMHVARHIERMHREKLDMLEASERALREEKPIAP